MTRYLPGDIVSRRKGMVMHRGIALGDGRVLHNTPFRGEHISSEEEFSAGRRLYVTRMDRIAGNRHRSGKSAVARLGRRTRGGCCVTRVDAQSGRGGRGFRRGARLDVEQPLV